jgi:geranylgeranyl diphosphate synthase, type II
MDGFDLLANDQRRQVQVDGLLDRFFSLAKNRSSAFGPAHVEPRKLHPVADAVLGRVR